MTKNAPFRPVRKDRAKTKYVHFEPRLLFRAICGSWVVRRSKKGVLAVGGPQKRWGVFLMPGG